MVQVARSRTEDMRRGSVSGPVMTEDMQRGSVSGLVRVCVSVRYEDGVDDRVERPQEKVQVARSMD